MATPPFPGGVDRAYIVFLCALIGGRVEYACLKEILLFSHLASIKEGCHVMCGLKSRTPPTTTVSFHLPNKLSIWVKHVRVSSNYLEYVLISISLESQFMEDMERRSNCQLLKVHDFND